MSDIATPDLDQTEDRPSSIRSPFLLTGKRQIWIVNQGKVDLFLVRLHGGEPVGARYHITRLEEGQAFFGMPRDADGGLLVSAVPGSDFAPLDIPLSIEDATEEEKELFSRLAAEWIEKLGLALAGPIVPKEALSLAAGETINLNEEEARSVRPAELLTWVLQSEGTARLFGDERYPLMPPGSLLPVTRYSWLEVSKKSCVTGLDMQGWMARDPEWSSLEAYHYLALAGMLIRRDQEERAEARRMEQRNDADQNRISRSIRRLAVPLASRKPLDLALESSSIDPLVLACEAVGQAMGVTMKVGSQASGLTKHREPISAIAKASGLRIRRVVLKGQWWAGDGSALLGAMDIDKSPVALLPTTGGRYRLYNPKTQLSEVVTPKVAEQLSAFAFVFYRPFPARRLDWKDLLQFGLRGCGLDLWTMVLMGVLTGIIGMLTPIFTGVVFDTLIPGAQRPELLQMGIILAACGICSALFSLVRSFALLRIEGKVDASVQAAVWDRLLSLPVPFFRDYTAGDLASRGMGIDTIRQTLTGSTLNSILSSIFSVFSFGLLFWYSWRLALLATGLVFVATCVSLACGTLQVRHQRSLSKIRGRLSGAVLQFISGISKFRISGTETRAFAAWAADFSIQKTFATRGRRVQNALSVFNAAFPILCTAAIFFYTAKIMADPAIPAVSKLTTGDFLAFNAAFVQFLTAMLQLSSSVVSVLSIVPLYERAKPILLALPEVDEGKSDPGELSGAIEISHLAFRYREDTPLVLRDVSISIKPGQFVAFVGASGCGKSTLFRLLLGFEKAESGGIYYDQQDIGSIDVGAMRRQIGVVLQSGRVLSGDIFTNIVGSAALTVDDAWEAAKMAGMDADIQGMPMGMHTVISEGGGGLSGGQKQRLMIARAIVGRPRILLFDEATSALDNHTQATVSRSLESLQATRIVIAHRLSTIINADQIVVLDKGVVAQAGTYGELIGQEGIFAELAKRQVT